jgi:DNA-binding IclR family transcriptional regulator
MARTVRELAERHGETVHLALYESGEVVYVDKAEGWRPIRSYTQLGGRAPAHCVATGKMLLSLQPDPEIDRLARTPLERYTDTTIVDPAALREELATVRDRGYAVNNGEWREGVGGVAVFLVAGPTGTGLALGFSGPVQRITENLDELVGELRAAVAASPYDGLPAPHPTGPRA